jgi:WD40 repeat protein
MATTNHSSNNKRHKTTSPIDSEESTSSHPIQTIVDSILNVDHQAFKEFVRDMDRETFTLLLNRLSELGQDMEDTLTKFCDIPANVIASNVFPFLENRTDWNHFSLVNKDINNAVTNHKQLTPPWPEGKLMGGCQESYMTSPTFSPYGKFIAHGDEEGNIYLWSRSKGLVTNWKGDEDDDVVHMDEISFSPAGNLLVTVGNYSNIKIWDLANDNHCLREWTQSHVSSVAFSPDGQVIATAGGTRQPIYLRNVSDGTTSRLIRPAPAFVHVVTFSPDGRTLALGGYNIGGVGPVELWKLDGVEDTSFLLFGHSGYVQDLAYSPDGTLLASASDDKTIKLWNVAARQCVRTLVGHSSCPVRSISFTPDGSFLASGSSDRTIRLWSITSGHCIESLNVMSGSNVYTVEFSRVSQKMLLTNEKTDIYLRVMDTNTLA